VRIQARLFIAAATAAAATAAATSTVSGVKHPCGLLEAVQLHALSADAGIAVHTRILVL
jgi:hypothetical protein